MSRTVANHYLAGRFLDAIERGDVAAATACYAPDAVIWHNSDGAETSAAANRKTLEGFVRAAPERRYENRRVTAHENGFVEQHVLRARLADGRELALPACLVCEVRDGAIVRLDEYFDSAPLKALGLLPPD